MARARAASLGWPWTRVRKLRIILYRYTMKQDGREGAQAVFRWNEVRFVYCLKKGTCLQTIRSPEKNNV